MCKLYRSYKRKFTSVTQSDQIIMRQRRRGRLIATKQTNKQTKSQNKTWISTKTKNIRMETEAGQIKQTPTVMIGFRLKEINDNISQTFCCDVFIIRWHVVTGCSPSGSCRRMRSTSDSPFGSPMFGSTCESPKEPGWVSPSSPVVPVWCRLKTSTWTRTTPVKFTNTNSPVSIGPHVRQQK